MFSVAAVLSSLLALAQATTLLISAQNCATQSIEVQSACVTCSRYLLALPRAADPTTFGPPGLQALCAALLEAGLIEIAGLEFTPTPIPPPPPPGVPPTVASPPPVPNAIQQIADAIATGSISQAAIQPVPGQFVTLDADGNLAIATSGQVFNGSADVAFDSSVEAKSIGAPAFAAASNDVFIGTQIDDDVSASVVEFSQAMANNVGGDGLEFGAKANVANVGVGPGKAGGSATGSINATSNGSNAVQDGDLNVGVDSNAGPDAN